MLTKYASSSECSLYRLVRPVLLIAADDAVFHIVIFENETKQFQLMPTSAAPVTEVGVTPTACHVVTALGSLDINLNNKYSKTSIMIDWFPSVF